MKPVGRVRKFFSRLGLLMCAIMVALLVAEGVVRLVAPQPVAWLDIFRRHPFLPFYSMQANVTRNVDAGEGTWTIYTDENGFRRGKDKAPAEDGAPTILVIGDSFAFGLGVNYEDSFAGRLAAAWGREARVVDAGVNGYGPAQYRQTLEYLLTSGMKPARVIVSTYPANDFTDCVQNKDLAVIDGILSNERSFRAFVKRNSHLLRLVSRAMWQGGKRSGITEDERRVCSREEWARGPLNEAEGSYRREFLAMAGLCRARGMRLTVVVIPFDASITPPDGKLEYGLANQKALGILQEAGVEVVDPTVGLKELGVEKGFFRGNRHLTGVGHEVVANCILKQ